MPFHCFFNSLPRPKYYLEAHDFFACTHGPKFRRFNAQNSAGEWLLGPPSLVPLAGMRPLPASLAGTFPAFPLPGTGSPGSGVGRARDFCGAYPALASLLPGYVALNGWRAFRNTDVRLRRVPRAYCSRDCRCAASCVVRLRVKRAHAALSCLPIFFVLSRICYGPAYPMRKGSRVAEFTQACYNRKFR